MALDFLLNAGLQHTAGRAVDDQAHLLGIQFHVVDHFGDPGHGLNASAGAVGDQQHGVHLGERPPGHVLQACLVVHHDISIVLCVFIHLGFQDAVDIAIAALALGAAHDQHIKVVLFDEGIVELHLGIVCLGHTGRNGTGLLGVGHLFPDLTQGDIRLHAQNLIEVGIGIGVHHQDGALLLTAEIVDDHAAGRGLADAAFAGNGNGTGCCHNSCSFLGNASPKLWPRSPGSHALRSFCGGYLPGAIRPYRYKDIISRLNAEFNLIFWKSVNFLPIFFKPQGVFFVTVQFIENFPFLRCAI